MILNSSLKLCIQKEAIERFPKEACGLVIAAGKKAQFLPMENRSKNAHQFVISAEDYARAEDQGKVLAVVHSHINEAARASEADLASCEASGLPWIIVSVHEDPDTGERYASDWTEFEPTGFKAPLIGRSFHFGVLDCYTLIRDFYSRELGTTIPDFPREDGFWERGEEIYLENFRKAGFEVVQGQPRYADVILIRMRSQVTNHGAVFLGSEPLKEAPNEFPIQSCMLHHLSGRLSERTAYGGHWEKMTTAIIRHESRR